MTLAENRYDLVVESSLDPALLRARLRQWEPWRHEVIFTNGVRTSEFARGQMFSPHILQKWHQFAPHVDAAAIRGGRALDVGSNIGHYSIFLRREHDMSVTGIEANPRNLEVARFLLETSALDRVDFVDADASTWRSDTQFALILHLGTLDHLRHPLLSLENAYSMLAPNGYIALELQVLDEPDGRASLFVGAQDTRTTCYWFLGRDALLRMLEEAGFDRIEVLNTWRKPEVIGENMARVSILARKPQRP